MQVACGKCLFYTLQINKLYVYTLSDIYCKSKWSENGFVVLIIVSLWFAAVNIKQKIDFITLIIILANFVLTLKRFNMSSIEVI